MAYYPGSGMPLNPIQPNFPSAPGNGVMGMPPPGMGDPTHIIAGGGNIGSAGGMGNPISGPGGSLPIMQVNPIGSPPGSPVSGNPIMRAFPPPQSQPQMSPLIQQMMAQRMQGGYPGRDLFPAGLMNRVGIQ